MALFGNRFRLDTGADIRINDRPLSAYGLEPANGWAEIDKTEISTSYITIPGAGGSYDATLEDPAGAAYPGRRELRIAVVATGDLDEANAAKASIGGLIGQYVRVRSDKWPGELRGRLSISAWDDTHVGQDFAQATATITVDAEPYLYGATVSRRIEFPTTIATDGNLTIGGNLVIYPTRLSLIGTLPAAGVKIKIEHPSTYQTREVSIIPDSGSGGVHINMDSAGMQIDGGALTVASDLPWLEPGLNVISLDPSAQRATLSLIYTPQTLI